MQITFSSLHGAYGGWVQDKTQAVPFALHVSNHFTFYHSLELETLQRYAEQDSCKENLLIGQYIENLQRIIKYTKTTWKDGLQLYTQLLLNKEYMATLWNAIIYCKDPYNSAHRSSCLLILEYTLEIKTYKKSENQESKSTEG